MKTYIKNKLNVVAIILISCLVASCGGDDPSAHEETKKTLTTGMWKISKVTVDEVDKTADFENMTLQFTGNTFTATNGRPVWPESGTWTFKDNSGRTLLRDDGVVVTIAAITMNHLVLDLNWDKTTLGGGRMSSIGGDYVFEFTR
jgi:hypothetical protein